MQKKMIERHAKTVAAMVLTFSILGGCVTTDDDKPPQTRLSEAEEKAIRDSLKSYCPASLLAYDDQRASPIVPAAGDTIGPEKMKQWIFSALNEANFSLTPIPQHGHLFVTLNKSFLQSYGDSIIANVVISAQYQAPNSEEKTAIREFKGMAIQPASAPLAADALFQQAITRSVVRMNRTYRYGCALEKQHTAGIHGAKAPRVQ
ncbi:hypothetical protein [Aestuariibacter sp. A3R04]|uniref:hypothetical protein n=1 Tax=Aestuariibacter sp. A3R04 TaxID=2841571 RepID=UPI001C08A84E|nr:hypothetical protein [Aestuariibacter sp. A3R04]MBU3020603.1 hypothetical protein [Aestuariibacter sp. A3R04]